MSKAFASLDILPPLVIALVIVLAVRQPPEDDGQKAENDRIEFVGRDDQLEANPPLSPGRNGHQPRRKGGRIGDGLVHGDLPFWPRDDAPPLLRKGGRLDEHVDEGELPFWPPEYGHGMSWHEKTYHDLKARRSGPELLEEELDAWRARGRFVGV